MQRIPGVFSTQPIKLRPPVFYEVEIGDRGFKLDYKGFNYVYAFSTVAIALTAQGYGEIDLAANTWVPLPFPETTTINIPGQPTFNTFILQCVDTPLPGINMLTPRTIAFLFTLFQDTFDGFTTGEMVVSPYSELAIDFTVYSITGGTAPTVTFVVWRVATDGQLYQLEKATPLTGPGQISYSVGAGLDGKSFIGRIKVDMVTTGNPTGVSISGAITAKQ